MLPHLLFFNSLVKVHPRRIRTSPRPRRATSRICPTLSVSSLPNDANQYFP